CRSTRQFDNFFIDDSGRFKFLLKSDQANFYRIKKLQIDYLYD
ncbi:unnamed protein product, partial [marine sediment metagenome]